MRRQLAHGAAAALGLWLCGCDSSDPPPVDPPVDAPVGPQAICGPEAPPGPGVVATAQGPVRGAATADGYRYLGIPYAAPPVGALRWQPPSAPPCRDEVLDATAFGAACPQLAMMDVV